MRGRGVGLLGAFCGAIVWCVATLGAAQAETGADGAQPTAPQPTAVQSTLAQVDAARVALRAERAELELRLADTWLKHEAQLDRDHLAVQSWLSPVFFGTIAAIWGAGAYSFSEEGEDSPGLAISAGVGSALSLGLGITTALTRDPYLRNDITLWGMWAELVAAGVWIGAWSSDASCDRDCPLALGVAAASVATQTIAGLVMQLAYPQLFVSRHERDYLNLPAERRASYIRGLLLERDARRFKVAVASYVASLCTSFAYLGAAFAADTAGGQAAFAAFAGVTLVTSTISMLLQFVEQTPSDRLFAGLPPGARD